MAMCMSTYYDNKSGQYFMTWRDSSGLNISTCSYIAISGAEWSAYNTTYNNVIAPFDYTQGAAIFSFFLTQVMVCWWVAKNAGLRLDLVRRAASSVRR